MNITNRDSTVENPGAMGAVLLRDITMTPEAAVECPIHGKTHTVITVNNDAFCIDCLSEFLKKSLPDSNQKKDPEPMPEPKVPKLSRYDILKNSQKGLK